MAFDKTPLLLEIAAVIVSVALLQCIGIVVFPTQSVHNVKFKLLELIGKLTFRWPKTLEPY